MYIYIYVCVCIDIDIWISEYMKYKIIMWYFNKSILTYVSLLYCFLCPRSNHFQISWLIYISLHIFEQYFYISTFWSLTYKYYILIFLSYGRLGFSIPYLLTHTFLYSSSLYHCIINLITMQFHYAISKEKISSLCHAVSYNCWGFPYCSAGKESTCNVRDLGLIPGFGRSPGEGKGYTPIFWPGEFHGLYSQWGHKELDRTEWLSLISQHFVSWLQWSFMFPLT